MATLEERVAALEQALRSLRNTVVGGDDIAWERSIQGRVYDVRQTLLAAEKLAEATREVRRDRARRWTTREKAALFLFAALTALAPYAVILWHAFG